MLVSVGKCGGVVSVVGTGLQRYKEKGAASLFDNSLATNSFLGLRSAFLPLSLPACTSLAVACTSLAADF